MKPKFCPGELVDFNGTEVLPPCKEVEIVESEFCKAGEKVFDLKGERRIIREDGWWYVHRGVDCFSPEESYNKRYDWREPLSNLIKREVKA